MGEKGLYSPFVRKIITLLLFAGISGTLLGMYYLVYLPQQHEQFNQRTFRVLQEITNNFTDRVANYGAVYTNGIISKIFTDSSFNIKSVRSEDDSTLSETFKKSFRGSPSYIGKYTIMPPRIEDESIVYEIKNGKSKLDTSMTFKEILNPLISIHANTFQAVVLIKRKEDSLGTKERGLNKYDSILYKYTNIDDASINITDINTDSFLLNKKIMASSLTDIQIEGNDFKIFVVPFHIKSLSKNVFLLAGLISENKYRQQSQAIPVNFLLSISFLLVLLLLALPFLKIFVLSMQENITIADVRLIIAVIFIIPFIITLIFSAFLLYRYPQKFSESVLSSMQNSLKENFYNEINQCIKQEKDYDLLFQNITRHPTLKDTLKRKSLDTISGISTMDLKDILLYPKYYKNVENVHWMNADGIDIASWRFVKQPVTYFNLNDRKYFQDIKYKKADSINTSSVPFSIQPTISRLTGEYTINIAIASHMQFEPEKKAAALAMSTKMYSLYNTVVPPGFSYCMINEKGDILCHSDTARNLQENLFEETEDNHSLHLAVNHKDTALIDDVDLYDQPVRMMIKPLPGLPYYMVTYYDKRGEYLFIVHILAFVFVCQSIILLFVSLFSYSLMMSDKKLYKLFFTPGVLHWLKPSADKKEYYIKNSLQLLICVFLVLLLACFLSRQSYYLYMLNTSLLLPLFAVTGYYIIKKSKKFKEDHGKKTARLRSLFLDKIQLKEFLLSIKNVLILYGLSILVFLILQNVLLYNTLCDNNIETKIIVWLLIIIMPVIMIMIATTNGQMAAVMRRRLLKKLHLLTIKKNKNKLVESNYLFHFILSILLSVLVINVIPAITFTGYALHEERKLHFQSFQIDLAKRIQQRRSEINNKLWQTKILKLPDEGYNYINSLKFNKNKGLYLYSNQLSKEEFKPATSKYNSCSPFYKLITQFLFLPPDHDEFYDNPSHDAYYYWKESLDNDSLDLFSLSYKNLVDNKDPSSIVLKAEIPHFYIFDDVVKNYLGLLVILGLIIFILLFYKIIHSIARRIFLIDFFKKYGKRKEVDEREDKPWLKLKYAYVKIEDLCKFILPVETPSTFAALREKENELLANEKDGDEIIFELHMALCPVYEKIWKDCTDTEKFTLYDFALDGFTNYKKMMVLYQLYQKGLLVKENDNFALVTKSFRNFLITKESSTEIKTLSKQGKGSWSIMRSVFYIILIAVAVFIFISQEESSKRLITIVTSLAALLPVILKLFDKSTFTSSNSKPGS